MAPLTEAQTALEKKKYVLCSAGYLSHCRNSAKNCFCTQNLTETSQSATELRPKNDFQYGGRPPF